VAKFFSYAGIIIGVVGVMSGFVLLMNGDPFGFVSIICGAIICSFGYFGLDNG